MGIALKEKKPINEVTIGPTRDPTRNIISSNGPSVTSASRKDEQHSKALSAAWVLLSTVIISIALLVLVFGRQRAEKTQISANNDIQDHASGQKAVDSLKEVQARYNELYGFHQPAFIEDEEQFFDKPGGKNTVGFYDSGESVASAMNCTLTSLDVDAGDQSDGSGPPMQNTPVHVSICGRDKLVENDNANPRQLSSRELRLRGEVCDFLSIDSNFLPINASKS